MACERHALGPFVGFFLVTFVRGARLDPVPAVDDGVHRLHVGNVAAFVRPRVSGGYVVALERSLGLADHADEAPRPLPEIWADPGVRMNDGGADPWGNLYAGSMGYGAEPGRASLYRITPGGQVSVVLEEVTVSNGIDFSPDGSLAYYNDTPTGGIDVFDAADGHLRNRRRFVTVEDRAGGPDSIQAWNPMTDDWLIASSAGPCGVRQETTTWSA